jgi:methionyl aminopeptidase
MKLLIAKTRQMARLVCSGPTVRGVHTLIHLADNSFNPFPNFGFSGPMRPLYPLSPTRVVPDHIPRPDYAEEGSPAISSRAMRRNTDADHPLRNSHFRE